MSANDVLMRVHSARMKRVRLENELEIAKENVKTAKAEEQSAMLALSDWATGARYQAELPLYDQDGGSIGEAADDEPEEGEPEDGGDDGEEPSEEAEESYAVRDVDGEQADGEKGAEDATAPPSEAAVANAARAIANARAQQSDVE